MVKLTIAAAAALLGVDAGCTDESEINKSFRKESLKCHPDKTVNMEEAVQQESMEKFKQLTLAREKMLAFAKNGGRVMYDDEEVDEDGVDYQEDAFVAEIFSQMFGDMFGMGGGRGGGGRRGKGGRGMGAGAVPDMFFMNGLFGMGMGMGSRGSSSRPKGFMPRQHGKKAAKKQQQQKQKQQEEEEDEDDDDDYYFDEEDEEDDEEITEDFMEFLASQGLGAGGEGGRSREPGNKKKKQTKRSSKKGQGATPATTFTSTGSSSSHFTVFIPGVGYVEMADDAEGAGDDEDDDNHQGDKDDDQDDFAEAARRAVNATKKNTNNNNSSKKKKKNGKGK